MSGKVIYLTGRRPKVRNLPGAEQAKPFEIKGDEIAIFMLREGGKATAWVSENVQTRQRWNYILDFLDKLRDGLAHLREDEHN
jgi:hypothetical protein